MPTLPTKKELDDAKPKFPLLPTDDYILRVEEIKPVEKTKYKSNERHTVMAVSFKIVSLRDGSIAVDETGERVHEKRRLFFDASPENVGFTKEGTASKTRQFICYMLDADIFDEKLTYEWDEFVGKNISARVIIYMTEKGVKANKISEFLPNRKKSFAEQVKTDDIPIIEENQGTEEIDPKEIPF